MSETRFAPVDAVERETLREPAKRWKNRWVAVREGSAMCSVCSVWIDYAPGDVLVSHCRTYPTASDAAADVSNLDVPGEDTRDWLGAFPVDESGGP